MFGSLFAVIFGALVSYYVGYNWKIRSVPNGQATRKEGVESPFNTDAHTPMRPSNTPFSTSSLPVEIMLAILSQAIEKPPLSRDRAGWFEQRFALCLSHVCSFWRAVMMENKSMWTDVSVLWDQHTIDLYTSRAGDLPIQYHLVMEGPSSRRRAESWSLDDPVQEFRRACVLQSGSSPARRLKIDLQLGGWPGFGRGIIGDNLGRVLERIEAPHLEALSINGIETPRLRITDAAFKDSVGLPSLHTVSLTNLTVANRSAIFHPGLTHLSLYKVQVEWGTFTLLRRLPNLRSLSISPLTVTLVSVSTQCHLPCLQLLTLRGPVRDINSFLASLVYPHTCSIDLCLMETLAGADMDKNTSYTRGVFTTLRERLAPYGSVDVFNHLDLETDPFSVRFTLSNHTLEHIPAPTTQTMIVTLVAFLPNRNFLLNPFLNAHLPGIEYIRTMTSTHSTLGEGGGTFSHHRSLWASIVNRTRHITTCVLRGRVENAAGFFDALEAGSTETLLPELDRVELENMDLDVEISDQPTLLDAGSSFWTIMNRRPVLKIGLHGCYIPDEAGQRLSHVGNVLLSPE
ncbi:hypothetical protein PENSPDRAFT_750491 [Peniophora sp. CONT]|nr:hypothetical protein PENSPDRAFT_750491 [Peniophora sp. CONT]